MRCKGRSAIASPLCGLTSRTEIVGPSDLADQKTHARSRFREVAGQGDPESSQGWFWESSRFQLRVRPAEGWGGESAQQFERVAPRSRSLFWRTLLSAFCWPPGFSFSDAASGCILRLRIMAALCWTFIGLRPYKATCFDGLVNETLCAIPQDLWPTVLFMFSLRLRGFFAEAWCECLIALLPELALPTSMSDFRGNRHHKHEEQAVSSPLATAFEKLPHTVSVVSKFRSCLSSVGRRARDSLRHRGGQSNVTTCPYRVAPLPLYWAA